MKKLSTLLVLTLLSSAPLQAQTGEGAAAAAKANQQTTWQNWTFAGIALVIAGTSIYLLTVNDGHSASH